MIAAVVGAALLATLTLYVTFAGADFGAGLLYLTGGPSERRLVGESITPVWESNHVWLIFALVVFWTAFPGASVYVWTQAAVPLWFALLGIVLRGAAFAFLAEVTGPAGRRLLTGVFAASSLLTPFFMGCVVGAVVTDHTASWTRPFPLLCGLLFVGACCYLAAVYLVREAAARDDAVLRRYFSRRAEVAGLLTGTLSLICLIALHAANPTLLERLLGRALPLSLLAGVCGVLVLVRLWAGRPAGTRPAAWLGVAAVVWAWGVAQYPVLVPAGGFTLTAAAAPRATLLTLIGTAAVAVLLVGPAFLLLFRLQGTQRLTAEELTGDPPPAPAPASEHDAGHAAGTDTSNE